MNVDGKTDPHFTSEMILKEMRNLRNEENLIGMARYGIKVENALGIPVRWLRARARSLPRDNGLAIELWSTRIHEAMIMATIVAVPKTFEKEMAFKWCDDFDSWDLCDQCCSNLFSRTPYARELVEAWCSSDKEFVRRAGFVMIAVLALREKSSPSSSFAPYLDLVIQGSMDERNNVKKAVSWALRQIGKRDILGLEMAILVAKKLASSKDPTARWVGKDALRDLMSPDIREKLLRKRKMMTE